MRRPLQISASYVNMRVEYTNELISLLNFVLGINTIGKVCCVKACRIMQGKNVINIKVKKILKHHIVQFVCEHNQSQRICRLILCAVTTGGRMDTKVSYLELPLVAT